MFRDHFISIIAFAVSVSPCSESNETGVEDKKRKEKGERRR